MARLILNSEGSIIDENGNSQLLDKISDEEIHVPHLAPHVIKITMPQKGDLIGIKIIYSSHCWSKIYDPEAHKLKPMLIMDNKQKRVFDVTRFNESQNLPKLLDNLVEHQLYLTKSDRNFGVYNATMTVDGLNYTAFFTLKKDRGRLKNIRHHLVMRVESAYHIQQPSKGMKVKIFVVIDKALKGEKLRYR